jgi:transcription elongation factor SPT6
MRALFNIAQDGHCGADARDRARKGPQTIGKIKKALDFMRNQHFEVPFIAFYRKEYVQPELNINDLWKVYKFDEKVYYFAVFSDLIIPLIITIF